MMVGLSGVGPPGPRPPGATAPQALTLTERAHTKGCGAVGPNAGGEPPFISNIFTRRRRHSAGKDPTFRISWTSHFLLLLPKERLQRVVTMVTER